MKFILKALLVVLVLTNYQYLQSQANQDSKEKLSLNSGTIDNQFEYVIQKSNRYQEFKVVKTTWLYALKAHTLDSLSAIRKDLADTQNIVNTQSKEIQDLKTNLAQTQTTLATTEEEKNNMALFGVQMGKAKYNVLMWTIVAILLGLLLFFVYKFKNSNALTREAKLKLDEVESEFEDHRRTALEREQKVRRQLQDEINKNKTKG
ncbi:tRNA (guanine-N1)-methyltransferase [Winogradskyella aurantia]|uniref:tRNA (Guanine-N1)-methyltransferase n=1 Tax=Winogradskyella aurantia TaxID=1915063 RepID=A0A265UM71_9FLAO|nr:tRNA (guanine-N1)-methyltransferase [Winogradskyella aurantia]OZV66411.1 tRNA (guanine-N1)-methyltransferase [Winogradskyella aurantia]